MGETHLQVETVYVAGLNLKVIGGALKSVCRLSGIVGFGREDSFIPFDIDGGDGSRSDGRGEAPCVHLI